MTEVNSCTKAGQLHASLSRQNQDSSSNSAMPSTEFVKASQLLGKKNSTSVDISGRNSSLPSFAPASKYFPTVDASRSKNTECSAAARDDSTSTKPLEASLNAQDSKVGFCLASELLPNHVSDVAATSERETVKKRHSSPMSMEVERTSKSSPPGALPDSTSEQNVDVIDLTDVTSERESKGAGLGGGGSGKKELSKATVSKPTGRKRKIDQAVAKTKKITYFFEK